MNDPDEDEVDLSWLYDDDASEDMEVMAVDDEPAEVGEVELVPMGRFVEESRHGQRTRT